MATLISIKKQTKLKTNTIHIQNLICLAKIDGTISDTEFEYIYSIGEKNGFSADEINHLFEEANSYILNIPSNDADRFEQVFECVQLMLKDGKIEENEMDFCITIAEKLGFRKAIVGVLVRKISMDLRSGRSKETIRKGASNFLRFNATEEVRQNRINLNF